MASGEWPKTLEVCPSCSGLLVAEAPEEARSADWYCAECATDFDEPLSVQVVPQGASEASKPDNSNRTENPVRAKLSTPAPDPEEER